MLECLPSKCEALNSNPSTTHTKKVKGQKIFGNHISDTVVMYKIFKNSYKSTTKNTNSPIFKMVKRLKQTFLPKMINK
jgi:hypothetical protein